MKQFIKRNILGFIIGLIVMSGISVGAATIYNSNQLSYKDGNVEEALNDLYNLEWKHIGDGVTPLISTHNGTYQNDLLKNANEVIFQFGCGVQIHHIVIQDKTLATASSIVVTDASSTWSVSVQTTFTKSTGTVLLWKCVGSSVSPSYYDIVDIYYR